MTEEGMIRVNSNLGISLGLEVAIAPDWSGKGWKNITEAFFIRYLDDLGKGKIIQGQYDKHMEFSYDGAAYSSAPFISIPSDILEASRGSNPYEDLAFKPLSEEQVRFVRENCHSLSEKV